VSASWDSPGRLDWHQWEREVSGQLYDWEADGLFAETEQALWRGVLYGLGLEVLVFGALLVTAVCGQWLLGSAK
jgi:hypothetical protein